MAVDPSRVKYPEICCENGACNATILLLKSIGLLGGQLIFSKLQVHVSNFTSLIPQSFPCIFSFSPFFPFFPYFPFILLLGPVFWGVALSRQSFNKAIARNGTVC